MQPDKWAPTFFDTPHLVVTGTSPRHMLAMKFRSITNAKATITAVAISRTYIAALPLQREA